jgi:hypothetical protein
VTVGLQSTQANAFLNVYRNTAASAIATVFVELHVGDPGAAGTSNAAGVTTRLQATWNAASGGSMTLSSLAAFTGVTTETISHIALWTASSSGTFLESAALTSGVGIVNGSTLTFTTLTKAFTPIAA